MLCKVLAHVPGVLLPCGRGCLHYYYPMGLFLVSLTLPLITPRSPSSHRPRGPPHTLWPPVPLRSARARLP